MSPTRHWTNLEKSTEQHNQHLIIDSQVIYKFPIEIYSEKIGQDQKTELKKNYP